MSIRLPKEGPWGHVARWGFVVCCILIGVALTSLLVPIGATATVSLASVMYAEFSAGLPEDSRVALTIVTVMLLFPLVFLMPAVLIAASIARMRRVVSLRAHVCPACDSQMASNDPSAPVLTCVGCNAVWRR